MEFTDEQQHEHREAFIKQSRQNAWGAACNADFIAKQLDELMAEYAKLKTEDDTLAADIKEAESAPDYHTVDNREKRKEMQQKRNQLARIMEALGKNMGEGQKAMEQLLASVESNLALAGHAEGWGWKETESLADKVDDRVQDVEVGDIIGPTTYSSLKNNEDQKRTE